MRPDLEAPGEPSAHNPGNEEEPSAAAGSWKNTPGRLAETVGEPISVNDRLDPDIEALFQGWRELMLRWMCGALAAVNVALCVRL